jgi:hypothetical protein
MKKLVIGHLALLSIILLFNWIGLMAFGCLSNLLKASPDFYCNVYCKIMLGVFLVSIVFVIGRFVVKAIKLSSEDNLASAT